MFPPFFEEGKVGTEANLYNLIGSLKGYSWAGQNIAQIPAL